MCGENATVGFTDSLIIAATRAQQFERPSSSFLDRNYDPLLSPSSNYSDLSNSPPSASAIDMMWNPYPFAIPTSPPTIYSPIPVRQQVSFPPFEMFDTSLSMEESNATEHYRMPSFDSDPTFSTDSLEDVWMHSADSTIKEEESRHSWSFEQDLIKEER